MPLKRNIAVAAMAIALMGSQPEHRAILPEPRETAEHKKHRTNRAERRARERAARKKNR
jgi:hypothetical protein